MVTMPKELAAYAELLRANGFTTIIPELGKLVNWFFAYRDGTFIYIQCDRFGCFSLSTVNKPTRLYGTGHRFKSDLYPEQMTVTAAMECIQYANRINSAYKLPLYTSIADFLHHNSRHWTHIISKQS